MPRLIVYDHIFAYQTPFGVKKVKDVPIRVDYSRTDGPPAIEPGGGRTRVLLLRKVFLPANPVRLVLLLQCLLNFFPIAISESNFIPRLISRRLPVIENRQHLLSAM
ncbi:hypothetical protein KQX54_020819 [Cotesia glomerata]|uniref:Uncharacterized protein n=1 Tax=Cotesia glomerata TaxID=32391 RepID=A0AAV7I707_COTGL|nr:hypothetical protein KQX54_020819 [Cotesia glomerata]